VMTASDVEHLLSMFFYDVRAKQYIEIRMADCLPKKVALAYAAMLKGLLYHEKNLLQLEELFDRVSTQQVEKMKRTLMEDREKAVVYGRNVFDFIELLLDMSEKGLAETEKAYLQPLKLMAANRTTLALSYQKESARNLIQLIAGEEILV